MNNGIKFFFVFIVGLVNVAIIETQILTYLEETTLPIPQIAGSSVGVGAIVPSTPQNQPSAPQAIPDSKSVNFEQSSNSRLQNWFLPTPNKLQFLYFLILVLICLLILNLYLEIKILKNYSRARAR